MAGTALVTAQRTGLAIVLLAGVALARTHAFDEPLERDLDIYAQVASGMLDGRPLYSDLVDIKAPGIFVAYALAQLVAGTGLAQFALLGAALSVATASGMFLLVLRSTGREALAWCAAAASLMLAHEPWLEANQPNAEALMNACMVWGVALAWGARSTPWLVAAGLAFAWATFTKQVMFAPVGLVVLALAATLRASRAQRMRTLAWLLAPALALWALAFAYFAARGRGAEFAHLMLTYPREYAAIAGTTLRDNFAGGLDLLARAPEGARRLLASGLALLAIAFAVLVLERRWQHATVLAGWALGAWLALVAPGHFYAHYFQMLAPPFVLGAAWMLWVMLEQPRVAARGAAAALALGLVATLAWRTASHAQVPPEQWSQRKYGAQFVTTRAVARSLRSLAQPGEGLFVWGVFPGFYRELGVAPPSGIVNPWMTLPDYGGSWHGRWTEQLLADLERAAPAFVVIDRFTLERTPRGHPLRAWIGEHYRIVARHGDGLYIAVRVGSPAQARFAAMA